MRTLNASLDLAVVWLDYARAKLIRFSDDRMDRRDFRADPDAPDAGSFHEAIFAGLGGASRILILGPGQAKDEFLAALKARHPLLGRRVVACEAAADPADHRIAAYAAAYCLRTVS